MGESAGGDGGTVVSFVRSTKKDGTNRFWGKKKKQQRRRREENVKGRGGGGLLTAKRTNKSPALLGRHKEGRVRKARCSKKELSPVSESFRERENERKKKRNHRGPNKGTKTFFAALKKTTAMVKPLQKRKEGGGDKLDNGLSHLRRLDRSLPRKKPTASSEGSRKDDKTNPHTLSFVEKNHAPRQKGRYKKKTAVEMGVEGGIVMSTKIDARGLKKNFQKKEETTT